MTTTDWTSHDRVDTGALHRRVLVGLPTTRDLWKMVAMATSIVVFLLVVARLTNPGLLSPRFVAMLVTGCIVVPVAAVAYRRSQHRMWTALADRPAEVLSAWRRQLTQQARAGLVMAPLLLVIAATKLFPLDRLTTSRGIVVITNILLAAIMIRTWWLARRELRELA